MRASTSSSGDPVIRSRTLLAPLALLGLVGCGGPLFSAEVVIDRFCFTQHVCPGSPPAACLPPMPAGGGTLGPPLLPALTVPLQAQLPPLLRTKGSTAILRLDDGRVTPTTAGTTLDGISRLDLVVQPASGAPVPVARYARSGSGPVGAIDMAGQGVNVVELAQSGNLQLQFTIAASGPPPSAPWDADLELCFYGKTVVSYF
jgi:hypothetical protein